MMAYADGIFIFQELPFFSSLCVRIVPFFSLGLSLYLSTEELEVFVFRLGVS